MPEIVQMYSSKLIEYAVAIIYLVSFVFFWRYVRGGQPVLARAAAAVKKPLASLVEGFQLPEALLYHPGHTWARKEEGGLVTVGLTDFARKLVGAVDAVTVPPAGARVYQGEKAFALAAGGRKVDLVAPVDGEIVETSANPTADGWLVKVRADRLGANARQLLSGQAAKRWMEDAARSLLAAANPGLGAVEADGGMPVDGIAKVIDKDGWDKVARRYFLTADENP